MVTFFLFFFEHRNLQGTIINLKKPIIIWKT
nr:MAG TPA: hypothetical protein [Caudoviricetes sp.]